MENVRSFPFLDSSRGGRMMFCFHHAGGSASVYRGWVARDPRFTVVPVELPGKATRMSEQWVSDFSQLAQSLAQDIHRLAGDAHVVLYGHSMGAALAYQCACFLQDGYQRDPSALIVAARQAPGETVEGEYHSSMGLVALREELAMIGGTPPDILSDDDIMELLLPTVHRDYVLHESFSHTSTALSCPILAVAGRDDQSATPESMRKWSQFTMSSFHLEVVPGGHFFPLEQDGRFFEKLMDDLERIISGAE